MCPPVPPLMPVSDASPASTSCRPGFLRFKCALSGLLMAALSVGLSGCGGGQLGDAGGATKAGAPTSPEKHALAVIATSGARWSTLQSLPLVPVAVANLPDGQVLMWSAEEKFGFGDPVGRTYTALFDPQTRLVSERTVNETGHNMFCPGTTHLADGRLLVNGGISASQTSIFDPTTSLWTKGAAMNMARGYNANTLLANGEVLTLGGSWSGGLGNKHAEIWSEAGGWRRLTGVPVEPFLSPDPSTSYGTDSHFWLIPAGNGKVFHPGPGVNMQWIDTVGNGQVVPAGRRGDDEFSISGTAVMYAQGKILKTGGGPGYDAVNANSNTYQIDINNGVTVRKLAPMAYRRSFHNSVVLPNGQVLILGGQTYAAGFSDNNSVLVPELWDPQTETFSTLPPMAAPRNYHSVALLLPDATVMSAGGGLCGAGCAANHADLQILTPHYLLKPDGSPAVRPRIVGAPATLKYGQKVAVTTDSAIASMAMVRLGAATHTVNNDQRRLQLTFRATGTNQYEMDVPTNPGWALPGNWMLFAMNADGTPSVARIVRISGDGAPTITPVADQDSAMASTVSLTPVVTATPGATIRYGASGLPAGVQVNTATGRMQGSPSTPGNFAVTLWASAGGLTVSTDFRWSVLSPNATRYVKLEALSEAGGNPWTSAAEIHLLDANGLALSRQGWTATASSQEAGAVTGLAAHAIDGNTATYWQSQWISVAPPPPHSLTIDMGKGVQVAGLSYLPRQDSGGSGSIARYRVYLSVDGQNWGPPVATGNFSDLGSGLASRRVFFRNVARDQPATQSSTYGPGFEAGRAVDGNTSGELSDMSLAHTQQAVNAWWEVDLGVSHVLSAVRLWNRTDCCADRLSNFYLLVSDTPMAGRTLAQLLADANVWRSQLPGTALHSTLVDALGSRGRYVRVQLAGNNFLQLAEVEVHGSAAVNRAPTITTPPTTTHQQGAAVSLQVLASDVDGDLLTYQANGLPPGLGIAPGTGLISGVANSAGTWPVTLLVDDGRGGSAATQFNWIIQAAAPQLQALQISPAAVATAVNFLAEAAGSGPHEYRWDFGDGSAPTAWSSLPGASHSFAAAGVYLVTASARNASGLTTTSSAWQAIEGPRGQAGYSSSAILLEPRSGAADRLWVLNPDNDSVSVFDTATRGRLAEINVGSQPRTLARAPDGRIWVANQASATLSIISPTSLTVVQTVAMPRASQPFGVLVSPNGQAFVTESATGRLTRISSAGVLDLAVAIGTQVRHMAMSANGSHVLAARFISPALPGEGTANVQTSANGAPRGGELVLVAADTMGVQTTVVLQHSDKPDNTVQGRGLPNYLGAPVVSPDGRSVWVPSKQDNVQRGSLRDGLGLDFQNTVRAISSRIDVATLKEDLSARIDHDNAGLASAAAFHPGGAYLFVALETSRQIAVVNAAGKRELFRVDAGRAPQGLVVSADGLTLYVHNFMDRSVGIYDLSRLMRFGESSLPLLTTLSAVGSDKLSPAVLKGKQLFYDARDPRLARDAYISCAACHRDGGSDGRTWDFTGFGEGLRNTPSLLGRAGAQGRLHWSANFDEVQDFEGQIRSLAQGSGLMSDALFNAGSRAQPLGDPKAGLSADLDALAAYVGSLTSFDPTPWRQGDGSLTSVGAAGRTVFANQCASCHGGAGFTNSDQGLLRDIGTLKPSSGKRLNGPLTGIDIPSLRDAWATAPYLHDGSAATIEAAVQAHNTITLSAADLSSVAAFVRQIGREEPAVSPAAAVRASPVFGTSAGTAFTDPVVAGQQLTGVAVRHWPVIYMLQGLATPANLPARGGSAGQAASVVFPAGEYLVRIFGRFDANGINQLALATNTGRVYGPGGSDPNPALSTAFDFTVPSGSRIIGFTGRNGSQLNAIGVLYTP